MSYPNSPDKIGVGDNPIIFSPYSARNMTGSSPPPPVEDDFLLMDAELFLLMDGTNLLLMGS